MHPAFPSLPAERLVPLPDLFWHPSTLHGQAHVSRVMVHATHLVEATGQHALAPRLWAAVFLHDLARRHDGRCYRHGGHAARRLREEPALQQRLRDAGLVEADLPAIEAAVTAHSAPGEMKPTHEHWPLTALLKDADGLDRVRLGDLDPRYLRHPEAHGMIDFAQALFYATDGVLAPGEGHFAALWAEAERLGRVG
ncbi:MAG TPA: hypothetical protein PLH72_18965 [Vicinamibacterales bacterium]|nr:hypothetical protein [Vicinamibacterales bacterium]